MEKLTKSLFYMGEFMEILDKISNYFDKGVKVSKEALLKAGNTVQELGSKSVTKVELIQLQDTLTKEYATFGKEVIDLLESNASAIITPEDDIVTTTLKNVATIKEEIEKRQNISKNKNEE